MSGVPPVTRSRSAPVREQNVDALAGDLEAMGLQDAPSSRTGLIYDEAMCRHAPPHYHPEMPQRITRIFEQLQQDGLVQRCRRVLARPAKEQELLGVHSAKHLETMKTTVSMTDEERDVFSCQQDSIYLSRETYDVALLSAGSLCELTEQVISGKVTNAVAVVRPPGHHAEADCCKGFCFFNSAAVAAVKARKELGVKRVMILDWDVHHGNGTQHVFEEDPNVLFVSLHRYDYGAFYPCSPDGNFTAVGKGKGRGFNVNIAWNKRGMGDSDYLAAFHQVVLPIAYEFCPNLIIISAGFDAAAGDPLGLCRITPAGYAHMTHLMMGLAQGRVIVALEGGYNLTAIARSMAACTAALLGNPLPVVDSVRPCKSALESINDTALAHAPFWKCLQWRGSLNTLDLGPGSKRSSLSTSEPSGLDTKSGQAVCDDEDVKVSPSGTEDGKAVSFVVPAGLCASMGLNEGEEDLGMFAVAPKRDCPHVHGISALPKQGLDARAVCEQCGTTRENWICLHCYKVLCGRYTNEHMVGHNCATPEHMVVLSFADLSVWCYACESYLEHECLQEVLSAAQQSKFGQTL